MKIQKKLLFLVFTGVVAFLVINQRRDPNQPQAPTPITPSPTTVSTSATPSATSAQTSITLTATESSRSAFALLNQHAVVDFTDYGQAGKFVTSINGLASDESHYWAFYLNGQASQTGASQTLIEAGDVIEFKYETIDQPQ